MEWKGRRRSNNVEDRRGQPGRSGGFRLPGGGGRGRIGAGGNQLRSGKGGCLGIVILLAVAYFTGVNPLTLLNGGGGGVADMVGSAMSGRMSAPPQNAGDDELSQFVGVVLADTEDVWGEIFRNAGQKYPEPKLVLFSGETSSACGKGEAAMGPFYCPGDRKVYIDLSFYRDLRQRYNAPGDFAQAYVIAHEVGHHLQTVSGKSQQVQKMRSQVSKAEGNALSVKLELQADCYAGVWAHYANKRGVVEPGDVEEAMTAAAAIGDDKLQKQASGRVRPESFTHGTSAQRQQWLMRGMQTGDVNSCDTFGGR